MNEEYAYEDELLKLKIDEYYAITIKGLQLMEYQEQDYTNIVIDKFKKFYIIKDCYEYDSKNVLHYHAYARSDKKINLIGFRKKGYTIDVKRLITPFSRVAWLDYIQKGILTE